MDKNKLVDIVNSCESLSEVLRKLNKSISGTSMKILRNELDELGIKYHFLNQNLGGNGTSIPLEEILKDNKTFNSRALKKKLIDAGLKKDKCECCGQEAKWMDKYLVLQLHHINGKHNDNRIENLQILCPNCHSQTNNFSNKKNKITNNCKDCGCEIGNKSTYCVKCAPKHHKIFKVSEANMPTKEELLEMIKKMSFVEIGKMYGITDNSIRKWCKKYNIPSTKKELRKFIN